LAREELAGVSIGDFVRAWGITPEFVDGLLLPAIATIATCTTADARAYPAAVVAGYAGAGVARDSVRRACAGADGVATRLLAGIGRVQCQAGLTGLHRQGDGVLLAHAGGPERFDHAVFATQANQALTLWHEASAEEAEVLRGFRYRTLEVVMHRDAALMPARRGDWSPVNARVDAAFESPQSTIWINRVQPALRHAAPLFQTVMPQQPPRPELVLGQARFERPLVDGSSARALAGLQRLHAQRGRRVWLCGSYAQAGVPLLESAVRSAYAVAAAVDESSRVPDGLRATSSA
jgi:predicted NAD/FAD-binding protein